MKKSFKFLILLTVLSGCNTLEFWKSDEDIKNENQKVEGSRHAPTLNNSGTSGDSSMVTPSSAPSMASPSTGSAMNSSAMASGQIPMPPEPPNPDDFMSSPAMNQPPSGPSIAVGAPPQSSGSAGANGAMQLPSDRRAPQFNQQMLGQNGAQNSPSGDLVAALPAPGASQNSLPQGDLTLPPPPPPSMSGNPDNAYPRLADIPPAPPVPTPADQDARVAQMKQDLADMQKQQSIYQSSGNSVSVVSGPGGLAVQDQTPRKPGNGSNQPTLIAQSPADPYLANAQNQQIQNGSPQQAGQGQSSQMQPSQIAQSQQPPPQQLAQTMNQASIMPQGPTIVVHSKNPNAKPYNPQANQQMAMASPPTQPAYTPMPPPQVQSSQLPPPTTQASMVPPAPPPVMPKQSSGNSLPRAPSMQSSEAGALGGGMQQSSGGQATTSLSSLHPIAVAPAQAYASNSDSPSNNSSQGLQPIPTNNIRLLPASRYETMRTDSSNSSGY